MTHDLSVSNDIHDLTIYSGISCCYLSPLEFQMIIQVRKYTPFTVVEAKGDKLAGSTGFNDVTG
jgi:hypothetical protein